MTRYSGEDSWEDEGGATAPPPPQGIGLGMAFVLWVFYLWCLFMLAQGLGLISLSDWVS